MADERPAVAVEPGERPLDHPPLVPAELPAVVPGRPPPVLRRRLTGSYPAAAGRSRGGSQSYPRSATAVTTGGNSTRPGRRSSRCSAGSASGVPAEATTTAGGRPRRSVATSTFTPLPTLVPPTSFPLLPPGRRWRRPSPRRPSPPPVEFGEDGTPGVVPHPGLGPVPVPPPAGRRGGVRPRQVLPPAPGPEDERGSLEARPVAGPRPPTPGPGRGGREGRADPAPQPVHHPSVPGRRHGGIPRPIAEPTGWPRSRGFATTSSVLI